MGWGGRGGVEVGLGGEGVCFAREVKDGEGVFHPGRRPTPPRPAGHADRTDSRTDVTSAHTPSKRITFR